MSDLARVKANIATMIDKGAPESDIDAYVASEGVSLDQLHAGGSASKPAPSQAPAPPQSAVVGAWGDGPAPPIVSSLDQIPDGFHPAIQGDRKAVDKAFFSDVQNRVLRGDTVDQINEFARPYGRVVNQNDYAAFKKSHAKNVNIADGGKSEPPEGWGEWLARKGHLAAQEFGRGAENTVGSILDHAPMLLSEFGVPLQLSGQLSDKLSESNIAPSKTLDSGYDAGLSAVGAPPIQAETTGERYLGAGSRMAGSFAVPMGPIAGRANMAKAALKTLAAGATSGVAGEAAHDAAPSIGVDPDTARTVAQIVGGGAAGIATAAKPIADARFVTKRVSDPRTPFAAKAVERMGEVAEATKPNGVFPKSRGPLSVEQINAIGKHFLNEVEPRLSDMKLSALDKAKFRAAIKRKADLTPDEIGALEGTPTGDAIAEGVRYFQATRALTPGYNGYKPGPLRRAFEVGVSVAGAAKLGPLGAVLGPLVRRFTRGDPADLNMSRLDAGRNALKRKDAWAKLGKATGSDKVGEKTATFIKEHEDLLAANEAEAATQAQAKAEATAARDATAAERRDQQLFKSTFPSRPKAAPEPQPFRPSPTVSKATSALKKLEERAQVGSTAKAINKLNEPPKPKAEPKPKARPANDLAAENNIAQGIHGNYNAYADTLGVQRSDVLMALRKIKTDDIDPFEIQKLVHGYKLSPAGRTALIPRLQKQLKDSGVTDFRAKQVPSEKAPQISDKAKSAEPAATNYDQDAPPSPKDELRPIIRPKDYERGANRYISSANREIDAIHADPDIPNGIKGDVAHMAERVRDEFKTKDEAYRFIDEDVLPDFEMDRADPRVIDLIRDRLRRVADKGKKHETQEAYDHALKRGARGRPRKVEPTDDVPF